MIATASSDLARIQGTDSEMSGPVYLLAWHLQKPGANLLKLKNFNVYV